MSVCFTVCNRAQMVAPCGVCCMCYMLMQTLSAGRECLFGAGEAGNGGALDADDAMVRTLQALPRAHVVPVQDLLAAHDEASKPASQAASQPARQAGKASKQANETSMLHAGCLRFDTHLPDRMMLSHQLVSTIAWPLRHQHFALGLQALRRAIRDVHNLSQHACERPITFVLPWPFPASCERR